MGLKALVAKCERRRNRDALVDDGTVAEICKTRRCLVLMCWDFRFSARPSRS